MPRQRDAAVIPCKRNAETEDLVRRYAEELKSAAPFIGSHGLDEKTFWESGLFRSAVERLRGLQSAAMLEKRTFISDILTCLKESGAIAAWKSAGSSDRHDYEVTLPDGTVCAIEAKGCLDGNNTNIFQRPANADEFVIWSLCQNPAADPRHNAWSGIHTRLSAEIVHQRELVDGLIIWDELCGGLGRPCPKLAAEASRATRVAGRLLPPPCIYLFPKSVPDPRNNRRPRVHKLGEVKFLAALHAAFRCDANDVTEVHIEAAMSGDTIARSTKLVRNGVEVIASAMTRIRRAR